MAQDSDKKISRKKAYKLAVKEIKLLGLGYDLEDDLKLAMHCAFRTR